MDTWTEERHASGSDPRSMMTGPTSAQNAFQGTGQNTALDTQQTAVLHTAQRALSGDAEAHWLTGQLISFVEDCSEDNRKLYADGSADTDTSDAIYEMQKRLEEILELSDYDAGEYPRREVLDNGEHIDYSRPIVSLRDLGQLSGRFLQQAQELASGYGASYEVDARFSDEDAVFQSPSDMLYEKYHVTQRGIDRLISHIVASVPESAEVASQDAPDHLYFTDEKAPDRRLLLFIVCLVALVTASAFILPIGS